MLAGPRHFISRAVRCRKALGGGMRQAGILAAAGKVSLLDLVERLQEDHRNARTFAQGFFEFLLFVLLSAAIITASLFCLLTALQTCEPPLFAVDMAAVETNILRFQIREPALNPAEFCDRMAQVGDGEEDALGQGVQVLMYPHFGNCVRAVWHLGISPEDTQLAIEKLQFVARRCLEKK